MPFSYPTGVDSALGADVVVAKTLLSLTTQMRPTPVVRNLSTDGVETIVGTTTYEAFQDYLGLNPSDVENERNLVQIQIADPQGSWRDTFERSGVYGLPVTIAFACKTQNNGWQIYEQYKGFTIGMGFGTREDRMPVLSLSCSGPISKAGSRRGVYASKSYQQGVDATDPTFDFIHQSVELRWYRA